MKNREQAICPLSIVPVRREPDDRAEQVSQWLFGETADVLEQQAKWSLLRFHHDGYEGWVDNQQWSPARDGVDLSPVRSIEQFMHVDTRGGALVLPFGAVLPAYSSGLFDLGSDRLAFPGKTNAQAMGTPVMRLLSLKEQWLNSPYLWGGRSPFGVDCSGLTQMLFLAAGIGLPRDAHQQARIGTAVETVDLATTGDLAFFQNEEGRIVHVGIVLEDRKILHASGRVRVDTLDEHGIQNTGTKQHTHRLRSIQRIV